VEPDLKSKASKTEDENTVTVINCDCAQVDPEQVDHTIGPQGSLYNVLPKTRRLGRVGIAQTNAGAWEIRRGECTVAKKRICIETFNERIGGR